MPELLTHLLHLEQRLLEPAVRAGRAQLEALLADDFTEVGRSGRRYGDRASLITRLLAEPPAEARVVIVSDAALRTWQGAALLTYRSDHRAPDGALIHATWRSSLWRDEGVLGWRMTWHQGTPCATEDTSP